MSSCTLLPTEDIISSCDASPFWIGAVLSHKMEDRSQKPVAFSSTSLLPAQWKYAQLQKEALAIVFGVKKFQNYLFGRKSMILSDHQAIQHCFSEHCPIPPLASAQIKRWALTLSVYDDAIFYKPRPQHTNADILSRLPLLEIPTDTPEPAELVFMMETLQGFPVNVKHICHWIDWDIYSHEWEP